MRYQTYGEYTESGYPHIGPVPIHWRLMRAKFLFCKQNRPIREEDDIVTAFRDGEVTLRKNRRVAGFTNALKEIGYQGIREGDFIIHAMDAFAGAIGISDSDGKSTPVYSVCTPIRQDVVPKYFSSYLRNLAINGFIESLAKGIRERSTEFRHAEFKEVWFPVPPKNEQQAVVDYLDKETSKIDTLIDKQQQLIKLLQEKRQAVISHAVTKGLNPDVKMKDSDVEWLGEVPEHWIPMQVRRILSTMEQGKSPACDSAIAEIHEWGVLKTSCVNKGIYNSEANKTLPKNIEPFPEYEVKIGDVLMSRASGSIDLIGSVAYVYETRPKILLSDKIFRLHLDSRVNRVFFTYLMHSSYMRASIQRAISGAEGMANNITKGAVLGFRFALPPIDEQETIVGFISRKLDKLGELMQKAESAIELMKERRTALISAAVTGKIDVRNVA